uniref:ULP_PROTEASE domain-containing protein n=1 Tax=Steinernema glaseri TaxID=37863 RepID=A0A1I7ZUV3_9BILA
MDKWLGDDDINHFCGKLQVAMAHKMEGMLAIQYITLLPEDVKTLIKGNKPVLQVLLDQSRRHYIFVQWCPKKKEVFVYDSLYQGPLSLLNAHIVSQLRSLFGHLYEDKEQKIPVTIVRDYEQQPDLHSCGYRAVGVALCRALAVNPMLGTFHEKKIGKLMEHIQMTPIPDVNDFTSIGIGSERIPTGVEPLKCFIWSDGYVEYEGEFNVGSRNHILTGRIIQRIMHRNKMDLSQILKNKTDWTRRTGGVNHLRRAKRLRLRKRYKNV